jgi:hypothetical protein
LPNLCLHLCTYLDGDTFFNMCRSARLRGGNRYSFKVCVCVSVCVCVCVLVAIDMASRWWDRDVISRRHRHPCARAPIPLRPRCCSGSASSPSPRVPLCPCLSPPNPPGSPSLRSARTYIGAELVWAQLSWGRRGPCSALRRPVPVAACTCPSLHVRRAEHQPARPQSTHPPLYVLAPACA